MESLVVGTSHAGIVPTHNSAPPQQIKNLGVFGTSGEFSVLLADKTLLSLTPSILVLVPSLSVGGAVSLPRKNYTKKGSNLNSRQHRQPDRQPGGISGL